MVPGYKVPEGEDTPEFGPTWSRQRLTEKGMIGSHTWGLEKLKCSPQFFLEALTMFPVNEGKLELQINAASGWVPCRHNGQVRTYIAASGVATRIGMEGPICLLLEPP